MPELPEVEMVRRGLDRWVTGRTVAVTEVLHPRAVRRHTGGAAHFTSDLAGCRLGPAYRRGKYLWLPVRGTDHALLGHLGMSGQLLVQPASAPDEKHLRVRVVFEDGGTELRFVDQRTFGGMSLHKAAPGDPHHLPAVIAHIARDPIDPEFDEAAFHTALGRRRTGIKRALLDQSLISGVGNIYADEALWRAGLHFEQPTNTLTRPGITTLLTAVREVMAAALAAGGTTFDGLYVQVNGASGYFDRSLAAYGREGQPCHRCGTPIRRTPFMNRSSYFCPTCQRLPALGAL